MAFQNEAGHWRETCLRSPWRSSNFMFRLMQNATGEPSDRLRLATPNRQGSSFRSFRSPLLPEDVVDVEGCDVSKDGTSRTDAAYVGCLKNPTRSVYVAVCGACGRAKNFWSLWVNMQHPWQIRRALISPKNCVVASVCILKEPIVQLSILIIEHNAELVLNS